MHILYKSQLYERLIDKSSISLGSKILSFLQELLKSLQVVDEWCNCHGVDGERHCSCLGS
jgi:hypothetical protein